MVKGGRASQFQRTIETFRLLIVAIGGAMLLVCFADPVSPPVSASPLTCLAYLLLLLAASIEASRPWIPAAPELSLAVDSGNLAVLPSLVCQY